MASTAPFDLGSLIECVPGVYGGRPVLKGTRFPILQVAADFRAGELPEEIASDYSLDLAVVYAGVAYYLANRQAIDDELAENAREYKAMMEADLAAGLSGPNRRVPAVS